MGRVLAIVAVFHLVLAGCSLEQTTPTATEEPRVSADQGSAGPPAAATTEEPLVTFWVEDDSVNVIQYTLDSVAHQVVFNLERVDPSQGIQNYSLVIEETRDESGLTLSGASLLNNHGELLMGIDFAWPADDPKPDWFSVMERTMQDEMTIKQEIERGRVTESYTLNGETRTYVYADINSNAAKTSPGANGNEQPNYINELPLKSKVAEELGEWEELASPENTLNYNQDGVFFVKAMTNDDFLTWVDPEFEIGDDLLHKTCWIRKVCELVHLCTLVKCLYGGGAANSICAACGGGSLVCGVASFFNLF
jgi:hypothetical protein